MEKPDRRQQIRAHLGIEPISHGQIYTFQIAVPESLKHDISIERYEALADSLSNHKTNLLPLIVRRTEAYSEEEEYEVVYGADWCIVAKEIDIEKLWVWFFDMNDEQAAVAQAEMKQLVENVMSPAPQSTEIESLLDKKLQPITAKLDLVYQLLVDKSVSNESNLLGKSTDVKPKIEEVNSSVKSSAGSGEKILTPIAQSKLNLRVVTEKEIKVALSKVKATSTQIKAAWNAIQHWKQPGKDLTWENLEKSTKSGLNKVNNFAKASYEKLREIADIRDEDVI